MRVNRVITEYFFPRARPGGCPFAVAVVVLVLLYRMRDSSTFASLGSNRHRPTFALSLCSTLTLPPPVRVFLSPRARARATAMPWGIIARSAGDCFILNNGTTLYQWNGPGASGFAKVS